MWPQISARLSVSDLPQTPAGTCRLLHVNALPLRKLNICQHILPALLQQQCAQGRNPSGFNGKKKCFREFQCYSETKGVLPILYRETERMNPPALHKSQNRKASYQVCSLLAGDPSHRWHYCSCVWHPVDIHVTRAVGSQVEEINIG